MTTFAESLVTFWMVFLSLFSTSTEAGAMAKTDYNYSFFVNGNLIFVS